ncbi:MAG: Calcineurin-like phosphoesterase, partial [Actinomycetia bacterium]|nr:Calcineurin-like phosphoesterase [Actinomycetes bacterium]
MTTIHDPELFTVGPDEVVVTFATSDAAPVITRVGDHEVISTGPYHVARVTGLEPSTPYRLEVDGAERSVLLPAVVTTLAAPPGRHLATVATVNDVHFGEHECGKLGTPEELGPVFSTAPGETPYWDTMNRGAIDEIDALAPDAVIVKGDLTDVGSEEEYALFLDAYTRLGDRMHHVRGNHDAMITSTIASAHAPFTVEVPGATLAVLDTVRPGTDRGRISASQLEWLDALAGAAAHAVLVFGHHHPWDPNSSDRNETYFGINPDDSEALCAVIDRHESIAGYFAGHTHRNRVRRFRQARNVPVVEVACVKDYPGAWAEYRLHEGGYTQLVRRIAAPDAMAWTE